MWCVYIYICANLIIDHTVVKGPKPPGAVWPPPPRRVGRIQEAPSPQPCRGGKARTPAPLSGWSYSGVPRCQPGLRGAPGLEPVCRSPRTGQPPHGPAGRALSCAAGPGLVFSSLKATPQGAPPGRNTRNRRRCSREPAAHQLATGGQSPRAKMALGMVFCPFSADGLGGAALDICVCICTYMHSM